MATGMSQRMFSCPWLLGPQGWMADQLIHVDSSGMIRAIETVGPGEAVGAERLGGPVIPGMCNLHSHAHQRLIAGLTGRRGPDEDSFWSWREQMYRAIGLLGPDDLEALATWLYIELLEGGYTTTGEFHYPHRLKQSAPAATSQALFAAAATAGCALTLLPVWYRYSGFGRRPASALQQPFVLQPDAFRELVRGQAEACAGRPQFRVGMAPHSLRAVDVADLPELLADLPDIPVHIHIAEQPAEVAECQAATGARPIELLADQVELDTRWCLVHATHASKNELARMAEAGLVVGLCPTTEADLGDGLFALPEYLRAGGRWGIGSDSNLITSAASELRLLEWGQRLIHHQRNLLAPGEGGHLGSALWSHAACSGAQALGQPAGALAPGRRADWVVLDPAHPLLDGLAPEAQLDSLIMAEQSGMIDSVYVAGVCQVSSGRHRLRDEHAGRFAALRRKLAGVW
jgi:formimidoylglutamate deiminase